MNIDYDYYYNRARIERANAIRRFFFTTTSEKFKMKTLINKIITRNKRARALHELQSLSDRNIADMGLNPSLVRVGLKAYPWK